MKNEYQIIGDTTVIFIKRKNGDVYELLIDTDDLSGLLEDGGSWCVDLPYNHKDPARKPYAIRNAAKEGGGREFVKLHRRLTNAQKGTVVDHINGDTLDNRKQNLRVTDLYGNAQNILEPSRNNKCGELNVYFNKYDQIWVASVMRNGKSVRAKRKKFEEAVEAAKQIREGTYVKGRRGGNRCS
jgi:hypothetical protein